MKLRTLLKRKPLKRLPHNPSHRIAFMHLPKTSGMTMTDLLSRVIDSRCKFPVFDRSLFGAFSAFETIAPTIREQIHVGGSLCAINDGQFIAGHLALSTLKVISPKADFMTVLREPRSRVLSLWLYWRTHSDDQLAPWGDWAAYVRRAREPLAAFLTCPDIACQTDNLITRMLLWPHPLVPRDNFIEETNDRALVAAAARVLDHFAFVDTIENPRFHANLQNWIALPLEYPEINATPPVPVDLQSPLEKELRDSTLKLLERRTRLDSQLWSGAMKRLSIQIDVALFARNIFVRNIARFSRLMGG